MKTRVLGAAFLALILNSGYISAFATPSVFYIGNVLLHVVLGIFTAVLFFLWLRPNWRRLGLAVPVLFGIAAVIGLYLSYAGDDDSESLDRPGSHSGGGAGHRGTRADPDASRRPALRASFARRRWLRPSCCLSEWRGRTGCGPIQRPGSGIPCSCRRRWKRKAPARSRRSRRRRRTPIRDGIIPSNFFMDSELCGKCHKDIYEQWKCSMHHFASFNNQFYRKSIEYMQDVVGHAPEQVVRGMSRSRGLLQRPVRPADQGTDRHAGSAGRPRLHVVPRHRARGQQHGQRRFHHRVSAAARTGLQQEQVHSGDRLLPDLSQPEAAPPTFMKPFMRERHRPSSARRATRCIWMCR